MSALCRQANPVDISHFSSHTPPRRNDCLAVLRNTVFRTKHCLSYCSSYGRPTALIPECSGPPQDTGEVAVSTHS